MNKLYITLFLLLSGLGLLKAQNNFTISDDTLRGSFTADAEDHKMKAFAYTEQQSLTLSWKVVKMDMPTEWEASLCDNFQCYFNLTKGFTQVGASIDASTPMPMEAGAVPNNVAGTGSLTVKVWDNTDSSKADTVVFVWDVSTGIKEMPKASVTLYPNPAKSNVNIEFESAPKSNVQVRVFNLVGQEQREIQVSRMGKILTVDVKDLSNGTYIIQFIADGKMTTQRFTKRS
ncbi:T9SS type A sorting domain-containing protein [bacterium]|nr:T9SS type A sorting domain-containing protein [bacterium]